MAGSDYHFSREIGRLSRALEGLAEGSGNLGNSGKKRSHRITHARGDQAQVTSNLWLYGEKTRKWRKSALSTDKHSFAQVSLHSRYSHSLNPLNSLQSGVSGVSGEKEKEKIGGAHPLGPVLSYLAMWWIGDHSLVLVTQRKRELSEADSDSYTDSENDKVFCLETISRAVTSSSLGRGNPQPEKHSIVVLDLEGPQEGAAATESNSSNAKTNANASHSVFVPMYFDMGQTRVLGPGTCECVCLIGGRYVSGQSEKSETRDMSTAFTIEAALRFIS